MAGRPRTASRPASTSWTAGGPGTVRPRPPQQQRLAVTQDLMPGTQHLMISLSQRLSLPAQHHAAACHRQRSASRAQPPPAAGWARRWPLRKKRDKHWKKPRDKHCNNTTVSSIGHNVGLQAPIRRLHKPGLYVDRAARCVCVCMRACACMCVCGGGDAGEPVPT